jgi:hypothetical protein
VLFQLGGRPMLSDLGATRIAGGGRTDSAGTDGFVDPAVIAGGWAGPEGDVYGLGALGWYCLSGTVPGPAVIRPPLREVARSAPDALVTALERMLDPDPSGRPSAAEAACEVYAAAAATPLRLAGGSDPASALTRRIRAQAAAPATPVPSGRVGGRWRWRWRWLRPAGQVARVGLPALALASAILAQSTPTPTPTPTSASADVRRRPTLAETASALTAARGVAFSARTVRGPDRFDAIGSSAWTSDAEALNQLRRAGLHYSGLHLSVTDVSVVSQVGDRATVRVTVHTSAYDVVRASGQVAANQIATPATVVALQLVRRDGVWRVSATVRADRSG